MLPDTIKVFDVKAGFKNFSALVCDSAFVSFTDSSYSNDGIASYLWNFGDPGSGAVNVSGGVNPSHSYVSTGPFNVKLQATSAAGCAHDTMIILNTIHPQPIASFTVDKPEVCVGAGFVFTDNYAEQPGANGTDTIQVYTFSRINSMLICIGQSLNAPTS